MTASYEVQINITYVSDSRLIRGGGISSMIATPEIITCWEMEGLSLEERIG
jgi:hypothetical protein